MTWFQPDLIDTPTWKAPTELPNLHGLTGIDVETKDPNLRTELGAGFFDGGEGHIVGFSLAWEGGAGYWPLRHEGGGNVENPDTILDWLRAQAAREDLSWVAHYSSYEHGWLGREGVRFAGPVYDTWVAGVLLDETRYSYSLDSLSRDELGERKDERWLGIAAKCLNVPLKSVKSHLWRLPAAYVGDYGTHDAVLARRLFVEKFRPRIEEQKLETAFARETALTPILVDCRRRGVPINVDRAERSRRKLQAEIEAARVEIKRLSGHPVDIWNATSLETVLVARGVSLEARTARGAVSITKEVLDTIAEKEPVARLLLDARAKDKWSQFIESALRHQSGGRVHPTVNQLIDKDDTGSKRGAVSGRFSYENPNLQQLPARVDEGKELVRGIYEAYPGERWAAMDYSQQEPRLMVHFGDLLGRSQGQDWAGSFVRRYRENPETDFYDTALEVLGWPREKRKQAKTIGLGVPYGMGGGKLCRSIGYPTRWIKKVDGRWVESEPGVGLEVAGEEGKAVLDHFDRELPFIKQTVAVAQRYAEERGWIRTLGGSLARFPPDPNDPGKRWWTHKAYNRLIQKSAADQTKQAMIDIARAGDAGRILVQVHDELGVSVAEPRELKRAMELMRDALPLVVPSKVDAEVGPSWGSASEDGYREFMGSDVE